MELRWKYDPVERLATAKITDNLYYTTPDGGQTINKFENGVLVDQFHKYGPENKFSEVGPGMHMQVPINVDFWTNELHYLAKTYPEIVGELHRDWTEGYRTIDGKLVDVGVSKGHGVNNPVDKIAVNRLCCPANETEWWDWDIIAWSPNDIGNDCHGRGVVWRKHKETGQLVRVSAGTPPYPCCVHPVVHGPFPVDESDIELHNGIYGAPIYNNNSSGCQL